MAPKGRGAVKDAEEEAQGDDEENAEQEDGDEAGDEDDEEDADGEDEEEDDEDAPAWTRVSRGGAWDWEEAGLPFAMSADEDAAAARLPEGRRPVVWENPDRIPPLAYGYLTLFPDVADWQTEDGIAKSIHFYIPGRRPNGRVKRLAGAPPARPRVFLGREEVDEATRLLGEELDGGLAPKCRGKVDEDHCELLLQEKKEEDTVPALKAVWLLRILAPSGATVNGQFIQKGKVVTLSRLRATHHVRFGKSSAEAVLVLPRTESWLLPDSEREKKTAQKGRLRLARARKRKAVGDEQPEPEAAGAEEEEETA